MSQTSTAKPEYAKGAKNDRLTLRGSSEQLALIRRAAAESHKSVTEFVLGQATIEAQRVLADRQLFELEDQDWVKFQQILDRPATLDPALSALFSEADLFFD